MDASSWELRQRGKKQKTLLSPQEEDYIDDTFNQPEARTISQFL
jgi:hypothetical protein